MKNVPDKKEDTESSAKKKSKAETIQPDEVPQRDKQLKKR